MMPNFQLHYNQGYAARPAPVTITLSKGRVSCQSGMQPMWWGTKQDPTTFRIKHKKNAVKEFHPERFADALGSELAIHEEIARMKLHIERPYIRGLREAREADDNFIRVAIDTNKYDPIDQHFFWEDKFREDMERFEQHQNRAYQNLLQSALGFEPTDHSDAPPYIPTTPTAKPKPCVDFGFEPTEASE